MPTTANLEQPLYSELSSDPDLGCLVELFVEEMPERVRSLIAQMDLGDRPALARTAHQLKGAAGSYGFHQLTPLAAGLESAVRAGLPDDAVSRRLDELVAMCRRVQSGVPCP